MQRAKEVAGSRFEGTGNAKVIESVSQRRGKACSAENYEKSHGPRSKAGVIFQSLSPEELVSLTTALEKTLRIVGLSVENAEDVAQEAMLAGIRSNNLLSHPRTWIRLVARRIAAAQARKERVREKRFGKPVNVDNVPLTIDPESESEQAEIRQVLHDAVGELSDGHQLVLMYRIAGWSDVDAAEAIGCSRNTVRSRLKKAFARLRSVKALQECASH